MYSNISYSCRDEALQVANVCYALGALTVSDEERSVSVAALLLVYLERSRSVVVSVQMSSHGEVTVSPEVQWNIPQLCGRPSHNHRQSGGNVFCLQSCWS